MISENYICTLPLEVKNCEYRNKDGKCLMVKRGCGFLETAKEPTNNLILEKPTKWYEQYLK